jgi:hypothetical protein
VSLAARQKRSTRHSQAPNHRISPGAALPYRRAAGFGIERVVDLALVLGGAGQRILLLLGRLLLFRLTLLRRRRNGLTLSRCTAERCQYQQGRGESHEMPHREFPPATCNEAAGCINCGPESRSAAALAQGHRARLGSDLAAIA